MDRLLFGDNQFFGVNHMSEERARAQALRFRDLSAIMDVLGAAYDEGITTFMCTTHDRISDVCGAVRRQRQRFSELTFYPGMPYAHKYANAMAESGMLGAVRRFLPSDGLLDAALRTSGSLAKRDVEGLITLLIDAEMKMFEGLATPVIFLQNVVVDLLLGVGMYDAFRIFADHVASRYDAEPGFMTMNMPRLLDALEVARIQNPIVCCNLNKVGFRMSGGMSAYEEALRTRQFRAIAMSVFASGAIPATEAIEWVCQQPNVQSILFGASSRKNIAETRQLVSRHWDLPA